MYIRSTGLGRTLLDCKVVKIEKTNVVPSTLDPPKDGQPPEPTRILMTIQTVHPVSWTVRGFVDPSDLWMIVKALTFSVIWTSLKFLLSPKARAAGKDSQDPGASAPSTQATD